MTYESRVAVNQVETMLPSEVLVAGQRASITPAARSADLQPKKRWNLDFMTVESSMVILRCGDCMTLPLDPTL